ncbi:hypothetical protein BV25DRAFT_1917966 [Artomyces pyxidatus]|uniref:Uncharacterized protein n=1 Tax=Artomyces pyxidatus TaxID=48021 RepID=A0ACB8SV37_9AGAM|nr:hypothetical protein BV25DRAFT_1917966 [Artomyces pyxidatus]
MVLLTPSSTLRAGRVWISVRTSYMSRAGKAKFRETAGGQAEVVELPDGDAITHCEPSPDKAVSLDSTTACPHEQPKSERRRLRKELKAQYLGCCTWFWWTKQAWLRPGVTLTPCKRVHDTPPPVPSQDSTLLTVPKLRRRYSRMRKVDERMFFGGGSSL